MTFYEAAVEVLRRSGRPLHFKKITETAIKDELLSHIGKSPEVTMEDRLDQEAKKDDSSWIVRTRPGVYMLREEVAERLNEEAKEREAKQPDPEPEPEAEAEPAQEETRASTAEPDEDDESSSSPRRRRRRGKRGGGRDSGKKKSGGRKSGGRKSGGRKSGGRKSGRSNGRKSSRSGSGRGGRKNDRSKKSASKKTNGKSQKAAASFDDLEGDRYESIGEAAFAVLEATGRKPMAAEEIASIVFDKKLVRFHTHDPEATVQSAIVTDNQVRVRRGLRPLFSQYRAGAWGLTEWGVSDEGIEKERQILDLADELRGEALKQLGDDVASLKAEAFEMVVMTLLERLEYGNLKVSKRTSDGDVFFTADWRRGFSDLRVCIHIVADPDATLEAEQIKELRETLEHYSASEGVVIHLGEISKSGVRESRDSDAAKVTVIDREGFVRLLVEEGIGVKTFQTPIVMVDTAFIDALQR